MDGSMTISCVLVFAPDGTIIARAVNAPGGMHVAPSAKWGGLYSKLRGAFESTGATCAVDSAFWKERLPFLVKSSQDYAVDEADQLRIQQATSLQQASEWGMRALQSSFPRIKERFV